MMNLVDRTIEVKCVSSRCIVAIRVSGSAGASPEDTEWLFWTAVPDKGFRLCGSLAPPNLLLSYLNTFGLKSWAVLSDHFMVNTGVDNRLDHRSVPERIG